MGWNGSSGKSSGYMRHKGERSDTASSSNNKIVWFLIFVLLIGVLLCLCLFGLNATKSESEVVAVHESRAQLPSSPKTVKIQSSIPEVSSRRAENDERERRLQMFNQMTPEEKIDYLDNRLANQPLPDATSNRVYSTSLEQTIDWIFSCELGSPPPILPQISLYDQIHLAEILIRDNPILETDSDKVKESKEQMKLAKQEFIKFIKQGGNPDDFLPYYHGQLVAAHDEWKSARESIFEIVKTEPEIALEYAEQVNKKLSEKGIKTVVIPEKMLDAFGVEHD